MRRKLDLSKKTLEGIVLEDYQMVFDGAESLRRLSQAAEWRAFLSEDYREYSGRFQRVAGELTRMADAKNLDGATLKYVELTMSCVECHKYVRSTRPEPRPQPVETGAAETIDHEKDIEIFQFLVDNREVIRRTVRQLPNGVETMTETDELEVRDKLRRHVDSMYHRFKENKPIRVRDPLFVEIFRNADKITLRVEQVEKGVRVRETSDDDYAVQLIKAHAEVISNLLKYGRAELRKNHPAPPRKD